MKDFLKGVSKEVLDKVVIFIEEESILYSSISDFLINNENLRYRDIDFLYIKYISFNGKNLQLTITDKWNEEEEED